MIHYMTSFCLNEDEKERGCLKEGKGEVRKFIMEKWRINTNCDRDLEKKVNVSSVLQKSLGPEFGTAFTDGHCALSCPARALSL